MTAGPLTTEAVPTTGLEREPDMDPDPMSALTTAQLDAQRAKRREPTGYTVLHQTGKDTYKSLGTFPALTQPEARIAAINATPALKDKVLAGEQVNLVAVAKFNIVSPVVENREPVIKG